MPRNTQVTRILLALRRLETVCGATLEALAHAPPADTPGNLRAMRRDVAAEAPHVSAAPLRSQFVTVNGARER